MSVCELFSLHVLGLMNLRTPRKIT